MRIFNKTKNTLLSPEAAGAFSFFSRLKGLLGRKNLLPCEALIIRPCSSVHTFFMSFPIDCLFLDADNKVIKAIQGLKPFRISPLYFSSRCVIELPPGSIKATSTSEGDILEFS